MSFRKIRKLLLAALVIGVAYWIYRTRPTVSGFVDDLTRPLFQSKAVVKESEHKRVVAETVPVVGQDDAVAAEKLRENMTTSEVRNLVGSPDRVEEFREDGITRVRWTYRRMGRVLVFEGNRLVTIAVR